MVQDLLSKVVQLMLGLLDSPAVVAAHAAVEHAIVEFGFLTLLAVMLLLVLRKRLSTESGD